MKITRKGYYIIEFEGALLENEDGTTLQAQTLDDCYEHITEGGIAGEYTIYWLDREVTIADVIPEPSPTNYRTVITFGDTQHYVKSGADHQNYIDFAAMVDWVIANKDVENIDFVMHPGDCIDAGDPLPLSTPDELIYGKYTLVDVDNQWLLFNSQWQKLEQAGIPYAICKGNHDNVGEQADIDASLDTQGFPFYYSTAHFEALETAFVGSDRFFEHEASSAGMSHVFRFKIGDQIVRVVSPTSIGSYNEAPWALAEVGKHQDIPARMLVHYWGDHTNAPGVDTSIVQNMDTVAPQLFGTTQGHTWVENIGVELIQGNPEHKISRVTADFSIQGDGSSPWLVRERYHQDIDGKVIGYSADIFNPVTGEIRGDEIVPEQTFTLDIPETLPDPDPEPGSKMIIGQNAGKHYYWGDTYPFINVVKGADFQDASPFGTRCHFLSDYIDPGLWVARWEGTSEIRLEGLGAEIVLNKQPDPVVDETGRMEFYLPRNISPYLMIKPGSLTKLEILTPGDEARYDAGEILSTQFINDMQGMELVRFMDWQHTNFNWIRDFEDIPAFDDMTWFRVVPPQALAMAANELNCDPWISTYPQATDECNRQYAEVFKQHLSPHLKLRVQWANEFWNGSMAEAQAYCYLSEVDAEEMLVDSGVATQDGHTLATGDPIAIFNSPTSRKRPFGQGAQRWVIVRGDGSIGFAASEEDALAGAETPLPEGVETIRYKQGITLKTHNPPLGRKFLYERHAMLCMKIWEIYRGVLGDRIIATGDAQAANWSTSEHQLNVPGFWESMDEMSIAPYSLWTQMDDWVNKSLRELTDYAINVHFVGMRKQVNDLHALMRGKPITLYECGDHNGGYRRTAEQDAKVVEWARSPYATEFYEAYFQMLEEESVAAAAHYMSHGWTHGGGEGTWGIMEYPGQIDSPSYIGMMNYINARIT